MSWWGEDKQMITQVEGYDPNQSKEKTQAGEDQEGTLLSRYSVGRS